MKYSSCRVDAIDITVIGDCAIYSETTVTLDLVV